MLTKLNEARVVGLLFIPFILPCNLQAKERETKWFTDFNLALSRNENIGRAQRDRDIIEENSAQASFSLAYNIEFGQSPAITFRGFTTQESFEIIKDLENTTVGGEFIYRWQPTFGYSAPFYAISMSIQDNNFKTDQRDSTTTTGKIRATKRVSESITVTGGYQYKKNDAESPVFDQTLKRFFLNADYSINRDWSAYLTYSDIDGPTWSTAQSEFCNGAVADDIFPLISWAEELETDQAFNNSLCGNWISYKLQAKTKTITTGLNWGLSHSVSLDFSFINVDVEASGQNNYDSKLYSLMLLTRF